MQADQKATITSYLVSLWAGLAGLKFGEVIALLSLVAAFSTVLINWRYKHLNYVLNKRKADHVSQKPNH